MFIKIITVIISFAVPSRRARGFVEQFDILSVGPVRAVPTCQIGLDFFQLRFGVGLPRPFPLTIYTTMIMMKHCLGSTRRYHEPLRHVDARPVFAHHVSVRVSWLFYRA